MTDSAIAVKDLRKTYAGTKKSPPKEALKGVSLDVPVGSIYGLLGPNGAGKSTLINILAGLVTKTSGAASIWGFDIDANPRSAKASIGVVPQEITADVFFTPKEGLEIQAGLYGVPPEKRRTMELLRALGLEDKADAYVRMLSGGMKRRLLVAKAMVHEPPVLILDEPTAGVDIELRRQLWEYVVELNRRGTTVVLTTHYLEEAQELCDRIAIINEGEVVTDKPKDELIASLDRKILLVTPQEPLTVAPDLAPFEGSIAPDGRISIPYKPSETRVGLIMERLNAAGVSVRDITTEEADLEDVFLELTYGAAA
ncbi:MAG: ABC transporter ATP-binding protein [Pseudomonadota bacterium]